MKHTETALFNGKYTDGRPVQGTGKNYGVLRGREQTRKTEKCENARDQEQWIKAWLPFEERRKEQRAEEHCSNSGFADCVGGWGTALGAGLCIV